MIEVVTGIFVILILLFGFVVMRGAPYLPTLKPQIEMALDLLDLKKGQTLLELGCGDGRLLRAAAERGINAVGYELNPLLVLYIRVRHWRYRHLITVRWADFWQATWPPSDGMYVFLIEKYMSKLDNKIMHYTNGGPYNLVSFGFEITGKKPKLSKNGLFLYTYK